MNCSRARIVIAYNPLSGRGRSLQTAEGIANFLGERRNRLGVNFLNTPLDTDVILFDCRSIDESRLQKGTTLIVCGGDGTVRRLLPVAARTEARLYHVPTGNECLFARYFGHSADPRRLLLHLDRSQEAVVFFGYAGNEPFFSMVSVGLDSAVVKQLDRLRTKTISTCNYVLPTLRCLLKYRPFQLSIDLDGQERWNGNGWCLVGNSPEYARRLPLIPEANPMGSELACRVYDDRSFWTYMRMLPGVILRNGSPSLMPNPLWCGSGRVFTLRSSEPKVPIQADGDFVGFLPIDIGVSVQTVRVVDPRRSQTEP